jgi:transglutaminase-like putative cysteine protease
MGRRLGRIAGLAAAALMIARLGQLLRSGPDIVQWRLILVASLFLGAVIWWLLDQLSLSRPVTVALFAAAGLILLIRISVPMTLIGGILPSSETASDLVNEMIDAVRVIRSGVPPVLPTEGVVAILAMVMWSIGALYAWGLTGGPVAALTIPSLVVYLQFAQFDRVPAGIWWMLASAGLIVLSIVSIALDRRSETGRARDADGRAMPRRSLQSSMTMAGFIGLVAVLAASTIGGIPTEYGNIPWRTGGSGFGGEGGRIAFDRFVDLRQRVINRSNEIVFSATLGPDAPPPETLYWRLETLDVFDGVGWSRSSGSIRNYDAETDVGAAYHRYQGSTVEALQRVQIAALAESRVPTAGVATEIHQLSNSRAIDPRAFRVAQDASVVYPPVLREGDTYQVLATYPDYESDLGVLASENSDELSPLFETAVQEGAFAVLPEARDVVIETPPDLDFYTQLPETPVTLRGIAAAVTRGGTTDYERAWMLERWFRYSGSFTYDTDVSTGHDALILDDWLNDPTSDNYRTGYCEQFATSMAVLGRLLNIPSRVVLGFTPGDVRVVDDTEIIDVRDTNAHAWVEMWMPDVGWVQFDPTPRGDDAQPPGVTSAFDPEEYVQDPGSSDNLGDLIIPPDAGSATGIQDIPPATGGELAPRWWPLIFPVLALLISIIPALKWVRRRRRLSQARKGDITAVWDEIVDRLIDLREPVPASSTPMELARDTDQALLPLAVEYSATVYGGRVGTGSELDLLSAENWISTRFDTRRRLRASLSTRSLLDR